MSALKASTVSSDRLMRRTPAVVAWMITSEALVSLLGLTRWGMMHGDIEGREPCSPWWWIAVADWGWTVRTADG